MFSPNRLLVACFTALFAACGGGDPRPEVLLGVDGSEHGPRLVVGFGPVEAGLAHERTIELINAGTSPVRVKGMSRTDSTSAEAAAPFRIDAPFPFELQGGEIRSVGIVFEPRRADAVYSAGFWFDLEGTNATPPLLLLKGETSPLSCRFELDAEVIDFGTVATDATTRTTFRITNQSVVDGSDCLVEAHLDTGWDPRITMESVPSARLGAGETLEVALAVTPGVPALAKAATVLRIKVDGAQYLDVPVTASFPTCLSVVDVVEFGPTNVCGGETSRQLTLTNGCEAELTIDEVVVTDADTVGIGYPLCPGNEVCPRFEVDSSVTFPLRLGGGEEASVGLRYVPLTGTPAEGAVEVRFHNGQQPLAAAVGLKGEGTFPGVVRTDRLVTGTRSHADLLIVMDDGPTMVARRSQFQSQLYSLTNDLRSLCVDLNVAVISGDTASASTAGMFLTTGSAPAVLNSGTDLNFATHVNARLQVAANPNSTATPLEAARLALSSPLVDGHNVGFLRPNADRWLLVITDRSDESPLSVPDYLQELSSPTVFVVGPTGHRYPCSVATDNGRLTDASTSSGGEVESLCADDWYFPEMSKNADCTPFMRGVSLSEPVIAGTAPTVMMDGVVVPEEDPSGARNWTYDRDCNCVEFPEELGEQRTIEVSYQQASCAK